MNFISDEIEDIEIENIKQELTNGFDTSNIDEGKNIVIEQKDSTITVTSTENQKNEKSTNSTIIDLGECENKIKDAYHIPRDKYLYILKIDVKQEGYKIPKIAYEIYYPLFGGNLIKLNLTACDDSDIKIYIPVNLTDDIDKINPASDYYNDICYTYTSEDGTDISLLDRKKNFIDNKLTVCEEDCKFEGYNYTTEKAICSCKVKTYLTKKIKDIKIDKDKLFKSFTNFKNIMNIKVLKCYKLIFNLDIFKQNYANLIMIGIIIILLLTLFIFYCKDYYYLKKNIKYDCLFQIKY